MKIVCFFLLMLSSLFLSCSDAEEDKNLNDREYARLIVGTWQQETILECVKCDVNEYFTYKSDNTMLAHSKCEELNCTCQECHTLFGNFEYDENELNSWKIEDGYLKISSEVLDDEEFDIIDGLTSIEIISITQNQMKLKYSIFGIEEIISYKRVK